MSSGGAAAPADLLSPVPLLEELGAIVDGMTRGHAAPTRADRQSLRNDLLLSCALDLQAPDPVKTPSTRDGPAGPATAIRRRDLFGGLIHEYEAAAA
jgi:hypothetical protein